MGAMNSYIDNQTTTEQCDSLFGATIILDDGNEQPITLEMIDKCLQKMIEEENTACQS